MQLLVGIMSTCPQAHAYIPPGHVIIHNTRLLGLLCCLIGKNIHRVILLIGNTTQEPIVDGELYSWG